MRALWPIASNTLREQWRSRAYQVALLFAGVMLYLSLLLGMLAVDQELRALLDFGLGFIETLALAAAVFGAANQLLREMETKVVYLVLSRPLSRGSYLLGRVLGLALSIALAVLAMSALHLSILFFKGWAWHGDYALAVFGILLKLLIAVSLTTLLALSTTSPLSALTMTGILWTLGHFIQELNFLARRLGESTASWPLLALLRLLPNLELLNFRDRIALPEALGTSSPVLFGLIYSLAYSAACLLLAQALIRRKDL